MQPAVLIQHITVLFITLSLTNYSEISPLVLCLCRLMKQRAWDAVLKSDAARALGIADVKSCQKKFKNFKDTFARLKRDLASRQPRSGSGTVCIPAPTWHLWNAMAFIASSLRRRQTTSNFVEGKKSCSEEKLPKHTAVFIKTISLLLLCLMCGYTSSKPLCESFHPLTLQLHH